jgi:hypothetical protein
MPRLGFLLEDTPQMFKIPAYDPFSIVLMGAGNSGGFGLIRHRVAHRHFCSKHCPEKHLVNRDQEPLDLKQRTEFSRA